MIVKTALCVNCGAETPLALGVAPESMRHFFTSIVRCAECGDAFEEAEAQRERDEATKLAARAADRRMAASGLPVELRQARDLERVHPDAIAAVWGWARGHNRGLLLTGPIGVGKTTAAAAACRSMLEARACVWTSAPLLFARLGSGMGTPTHARAVELLTATGALILDDLDKVRPTEYGAEQVFVAVDGRVTAGAPLLVTTNLGLDELAARWPEPFGEAIASRLAGYSSIVHLDGPDLRTVAQVAA